MKTILMLIESSGLSHIEFSAPVPSSLGEITGVTVHGFDIDRTANAGDYNELDTETLEAVATQLSEEIENINDDYFWEEWA